MGEISLECAIVGQAGTFDVTIDDEKKVSVLKKAIKAEKTVGFKDIDADTLQLFLAKGANDWLDVAGATAVAVDKTSGIPVMIDEHGNQQGFVHMDPTLFIKNPKHFGVNFQPGEGQVHVLVVIPKAGVGSPSASFLDSLPSTTALADAEKFATECSSLTEWDVAAVHKIPLIWQFMSSLGGCTSNGEIFWRQEDKQVVSLLVDGWFRESTPGNINAHERMKSILMGSPGIGKSTLLCVMAFYLVFKHKKNVLVYRRLTKFDEENCLLYLGYEGDKVVYFSVLSCEESEAKRIYRALWEQHGVSKVWLLLDGFRYQDIPEGVRTFKMLATSQQVDLKSQERVDAYCCLLPCWSKKDLWLIGGLIFKFASEDMDERFYYSGGSVREFTFATSENIRSAIDDAVSQVEDASHLLSNKSSASTGRSQLDRLRHTFVKDVNDISHFTARRNWEQVVDSEYGVLALSVKLRSDALFRIFSWARGAGHRSLAGSAFELYLHRLAADNALKLYISEYDPPVKRKPKELRHLELKQVSLRNGGAICCGTAKVHQNDLTKWRDDDNLTYWFPACHNFPNIDSIVKLESVSGDRLSTKKSNVAYLQITIAEDHEIDGKQLELMNAIFFPKDVADTGKTEPPIYIAVCPDLESCKELILKPPPEVLAARKTCRVYVGYYDEAPFYTAADGPRNNVPAKGLPPLRGMRDASECVCSSTKCASANSLALLSKS